MASEIAVITGALAPLSGANLLAIIAGGLSIALPLVLIWVAFRFIYRKVKGAMKRGV